METGSLTTESFALDKDGTEMSLDMRKSIQSLPCGLDQDRHGLLGHSSHLSALGNDYVFSENKGGLFSIFVAYLNSCHGLRVIQNGRRKLAADDRGRLQ